MKKAKKAKRQKAIVIDPAFMQALVIQDWTPYLELLDESKWLRTTFPNQNPSA